MNNDNKDTLNIVFYSFFGLFLIIFSIYGILNWNNVKPPSKYTNTLQRDINP